MKNLKDLAAANKKAAEAGPDRPVGQVPLLELVNKKITFSRHVYAMSKLGTGIRIYFITADGEEKNTLTSSESLIEFFTAVEDNGWYPFTGRFRKLPGQYGKTYVEVAE